MDWFVSINLMLLTYFSSFVIGDEVAKNEVIGEPTVSCAADAIYVKFRTKSTFLGHVDVKYTPDKSCFQSLVTNNQIEVLIPHEECMVPRRRSLYPVGLSLEVVLSVAFNPEFTTSDDRVFNLQCFHKQNKTSLVKTETEAIGSPTTPPTDIISPKCEYFVFSDEIKRIEAGRLSLGDIVYHRWECSNIQQNMCMSVENCELVGGEQKHLVIDSNGCSKYDHIMPQIQYHNDTSASAKVKVFGVSHSPIVYFSCQIHLQPSDPKTNQCPQPDCSASKKLRRKRESLNMIDVRSQNLEISQLVETDKHHKQGEEEDHVRVIQANCPQHIQELNTSTKQMKNAQICAEFQDVLIVSMFLTIGCIITTSVVVVLIVRRQKYEIASMT